jgi:hypothetical protein
VGGSVDKQIFKARSTLTGEHHNCNRNRKIITNNQKYGWKDRWGKGDHREAQGTSKEASVPRREEFLLKVRSLMKRWRTSKIELCWADGGKHDGLGIPAEDVHQKPMANEKQNRCIKIFGEHNTRMLRFFINKNSHWLWSPLLILQYSIKDVVCITKKKLLMCLYIFNLIFFHFF